MSQEHVEVEEFGKKERCYKCDRLSDYIVFGWTSEIHCVTLWCCWLHFLMKNNDTSEFIMFGFRRIFIP